MPFANLCRNLIGKRFVAFVFIISAVLLWFRLPPAPRLTLDDTTGVRFLGVSSAGDWFAVATEEQIEIRSVLTGETKTTFAITDDEPIGFGAFSPDDTRFVVATSESLRLHALNNSDSELEFPLSITDIVMWSPGGPIFNRKPRSFEFSQDGRWMSVLVQTNKDIDGGFDCHLELLDLSHSGGPQPLMGGLTNCLTAAAFSSDGKMIALATLSEDTKPEVHVWDTETRAIVRRLKVPNTKSGDESGKQIDYSSYPPVSILFTPDGQNLIGLINPQSAGRPDKLCIWDLESAELVSEMLFDRQAGNCPSLELLSNGKRLLVGGGGGFLNFGHVVDLTLSEPRVEATFNNVPVVAHDNSRIAVSNQGNSFDRIFKYIARPGEATFDRPAVRVLNLDDWQWATVDRPWLNADVRPIAFSIDDRTIAIHCRSVLDHDRWGTQQWMYPLWLLLGKSRCVHLHDPANGRRLASLPGSDACFSPDGSTLVTHGYGEVRLYDFPVQTPWIPILAWSILPTFVVLVYLNRKSRRPRKGASD